MALRASHGKIWPCGHRLAYDIAWRASHGIWLWPGRQGMELGIVMVWPDGHGMIYAWPGGHRMVYAMAWRASHAI